MTAHGLGRGHERARNLAAQRADEPLAPDEEAWLADHLEYCDACAAVAAEYDAQHQLFADLRAYRPAPPRDLWARTSAAIEAERAGRPASRGWRRLLRAPRPAQGLPPAAVVAAVIVAMVVGVGVLNSNALMPGGVAGPTPIAVEAAAAIQVIARDSAGNLQILSRPVDQVCPIGVSACGVQPTFAVTAVTGLGSATDIQGALSPTGGQMVVVTHGVGGGGVYVIPVKSASTPAPAASAPATTTPAASTAVAVSSAPSATGSPAPAATPTPSARPPSPSSATPPAVSAELPSATASAAVSPTEVPSSAAPSDSESGEPPVETASSEPLQPTGSASVEPSAMPSVAVSPAPDAAIRIASGVTVVGAPMYAPDGVHLAFAAMPSDGSAGPDIYVWAAGDPGAQPITSDHDSWLAAWTADGILVSRPGDGSPATYLLDPATGDATQVGPDGTWLPAVSPDGSSAVWWSGTVKLAPDGVTWVPDTGGLVLGGWSDTAPGDSPPEAAASADAPADSLPTPSPGSSPQVLATGPLTGFTVRWADDGSALAVWTAAPGDAHAGELSLYRMDATTQTFDLANPMLDKASANSDFSLRTGRLAWTSPSAGASQAVQVLAWSGKAIGRLVVQADGGSTVIP